MLGLGLGLWLGLGLGLGLGLWLGIEIGLRLGCRKEVIIKAEILADRASQTEGLANPREGLGYQRGYSIEYQREEGRLRVSKKWGMST